MPAPERTVRPDPGLSPAQPWTQGASRHEPLPNAQGADGPQDCREANQKLCLRSYDQARSGGQDYASSHDANSALALAFEQSERRCNGQDKAARLAGKERESEVLIEALRGIVLRIDDEREDPELGTCRAFERIDQERRTESSALIGLRDGEATEKGGGHEGITRELASHVLRKRIERHAGPGERVEAGNLLGLGVERDEACGDATPDVLRSLQAQVPVERARSAEEA